MYVSRLSLIVCVSLLCIGVCCLEYVELGSTGVKVSRVGLGFWQFGGAWGPVSRRRAVGVISRALELGINFFDTAMRYGNGLSEYLLGLSLREAGAKRDEVIVSTKIPGEFLNPLDIPRSVEKSLRNLGFDYIDIVLAHWPPCWSNVPICVYARSMEKLVKMGRASFLGLSDHPVELVERFRECLAREDIVVLQIGYNLVERWAEEDHIPYAELNSMSIQAWSPLAKGALTGKYEPGRIELQDFRRENPLFHPHNYSRIWSIVKLLGEVGEKYGKKPVQVALNWLIMSSPVVIPIPGAKTAEQVDDIAGSVGWRMKYSDWLLLDEATRNLPIQYSVGYEEFSPEEKLREYGEEN